MNTYPILVVNDRYESAIADAASHQLVGEHGTSVSKRIAAAAEGLRRFLANDARPSRFPRFATIPTGADSSSQPPALLPPITRDLRFPPAEVFVCPGSGAYVESRGRSAGVSMSVSVAALGSNGRHSASGTIVGASSSRTARRRRSPAAIAC